MISHVEYYTGLPCVTCFRGNHGSLWDMVRRGISPDPCPATSHSHRRACGHPGNTPGGWHGEPGTHCKEAVVLIPSGLLEELHGAPPLHPNLMSGLGCRGCKEVAFSSRMKLPSAFTLKLISLHPTPLRKGVLQGRVVFRSW